MIVFLDLEQTVIDNWSNANFLSENIEIIKAGLRDGDRLGLMSWAVWDGTDKERFNQVIRVDLEIALGTVFEDELILSMTDISDIILKNRKKWISREDMFDLFSKEECLLSLLRMKWFPRGEIVVLIDDAVDHTLQFTLNDTNVMFINIEECPHG